MMEYIIANKTDILLSIAIWGIYFSWAGWSAANKERARAASARWVLLCNHLNIEDIDIQNGYHNER